MLDIEVVRLDWFRSETYQDFYRYMDSVGLLPSDTNSDPIQLGDPQTAEVVSGCIDGATTRWKPEVKSQIERR